MQNASRLKVTDCTDFLFTHSLLNHILYESKYILHCAWLLFTHAVMKVADEFDVRYRFLQAFTDNIHCCHYTFGAKFPRRFE